MIERLWTYFGLVGVASIIAAGAAALTWAAFCRSRLRTRAYLAGLGLAAAAYILAQVNSAAVSRIRVDRSAVYAAVQQRQADEADANVPLYKQRGKQDRDEGKTREADELTFASEPGRRDAARQGRSMPPADVERANRWDRMNLLAVKLVLFGAGLAVVTDYLLRFRTTFHAAWPLPITCRPLDYALGKSRAVHWQCPSEVELKRFLERCVRKGESFLLLADADPWPDADALPRLPGPLERLAVLRKVAVGEGGLPDESEWTFESAWFDRCGVVVVGADPARAALDDFERALRLRHVPNAAAWRTVNLVLTPAIQLSCDRLAELARLCREANFRLVVVSDAPPAEDERDLFDEIG